MGAAALSKPKFGSHYTPALVYSAQDDVELIDFLAMDKIGSDDSPMNHPPCFPHSNYELR